MKTLITGATRGIGHQLSVEFATHGHDLILVARDEALLRQLAVSLSHQYGVQVETIIEDLAHPDSSKALISKLDGNNIDCLVNNAGIGFLGEFSSMDDERLSQLIYLNMVTLTTLTHHFVKEFKAKNRGKILQVASMAAFQPGPRMALYYASKAYVVSLSRAIAYELKGSGVSLSILCPGPTKTDFMKTAHMERSNIGGGRFGLLTAETVAKAGYCGLMQNKLMIIPGITNKLLAIATALTPTTLSERIAYYLHSN